jgi:hypothetical protein
METAICVITMARCTENRSRLPATPRSPVFNEATGSAAVLRSAGSVPKIRQVEMAAAAANSSTRQSAIMAS